MQHAKHSPLTLPLLVSATDTSPAPLVPIMSTAIRPAVACRPFPVFSSHSHTRNTRHPIEASSRATLASRSTLRSNLAFQNPVFDFWGATLHPTWQCQEHQGCGADGPGMPEGSEPGLGRQVPGRTDPIFRNAEPSRSVYRIDTNENVGGFVPNAALLPRTGQSPQTSCSRDSAGEERGIRTPDRPLTNTRFPVVEAKSSLVGHYRTRDLGHRSDMRRPGDGGQAIIVPVDLPANLRRASARALSGMGPKEAGDEDVSRWDRLSFGY